MKPSKAWITGFLNGSLINHTFCVFVRLIKSILKNIQNVCVPNELHGIIDEKKTRSADFFFFFFLRSD